MDDIEKAYAEVLKATQVQPCDNEITRLKKSLTQASLDASRKETYMRGLEQLVEDLKKRVAELEEICRKP